MARGERGGDPSHREWPHGRVDGRLRTRLKDGRHGKSDGKGERDFHSFGLMKRWNCQGSKFDDSEIVVLFTDFYNTIEMPESSFKMSESSD